MFSETPEKSALQQQEMDSPSLRANLKDYIEEKPASAILIGFGVGIGAGLLAGAILQKATPSMAQQTDISEKLTDSIKKAVTETVPDFFKKHLSELKKS